MLVHEVYFPMWYFLNKSLIFLNLRSFFLRLKHHSFAHLTPFVDDGGIICVGGRLQYSDASDTVKFPILLPKSCNLGTFIISHNHLQYLHAGPQFVVSLLLARYWIVSGRSVIRNVLFKCVICARHTFTFNHVISLHLMFV